MIKKLLTLCTLIFTVGLNAQNSLEVELDSIFNENDANELIIRSKKNKGKIITFNTAKHDTQLANDIYKLSVGGKKAYKYDSKIVYYKVLNKLIVPHYRMGYIFLDKNILSELECEEKIARIKARHNQGQNFVNLASQYSMDNSAYKGGDSGWFTEGTYFEEIETALNSNKFLSGELMVVDVPNKNFTFLIYKSHPKMQIEEYKVLKMTDFAK